MNSKKETTRQLHIRLPSGIYKKLKVKCVHNDISMQNYVAQLINMSLDHSKKWDMENERGENNKVDSK